MLITKFFKRNLEILARKYFYNFTRISRSYNDVAFEDIPEVSPTLIKKVLKSQNINYEEGYTCFITPCVICPKTSKSAKLYVNKTTGMFMCTLCKRTGSWNELEANINVKKSRKVKKQEVNIISELEKINNTLEDVKKTTSELKLLNNDAMHEIFLKFKLPVISANALDNLPVRINEPQTQMFFPLENVESEIVGYKKVHSRLNEDIIIPDIKCGGLLTGKATKNKDVAVLVPSVADFLVLLNAKLNVHVVCLPNGVNSLSQYVLPSLERFKKLILWLGVDNSSWDAAVHFSRKIGEKRCQLIRPTERRKLPHLDTEQDFKSIIAEAQPMWHKSITTFATLRAEVLSDLQNIDKVQGVKWKRFPSLSKILKGHRRGELTVITGPTGCGKTTFISEYSLDLAMQGVNTLWGSFEIRNARLAKTMLQQMAGFPLDENLALFDELADTFEKLPIYFMTFHGQQAIKIVMEAVEHATYVYDIAHVIIDNLQFMMGTSDEQKHMDRFWKQDAIIQAFRQFATRKNCHVTLVIHPRKERDDEDLTTSSIFGGAKASQEADNVLIIQDKRLTSVRGKKYLQVAKNRYSGDLGVMGLEFDKGSLSFQQKKAKEKKPLDTVEPLQPASLSKDDKLEV